MAQHRDVPFRGDGADVARLSAAFEALESSDDGRPIAEAIREKGTVVEFGQTVRDAVAQYDRRTNTITVHESLRDANPSVVASHLAHEGEHVQWQAPGSIDQEYAAYKAEAEVWDELKGDETDGQCDAVSAMIARGEAEAKAEIRQMYSYLPEHWPA
ncbi:MAG: hypothetical protein HY690_15315 [Chloroflexi bacterium]|nr:hypothetical protein [Chloroflexota bacterium]